MKYIFNFNTNTHNFWPIYNTITKFYPIGLRKDEQSILFDYPGTKDLGKIVVDTIHKENEFYKLWLAFQDKLASILNKTYRGTTMGQSPSLSFDIFLEKTEGKNFVINKKLCLNLSLLGKFYTIYGIDDSAVLEYQDNQISKQYYATNAITVSPYKEFEQPFKKAQDLIEATFPDYKFIPFIINDMIINGLRISYSDKEICSVYDALFNNKFDYVAESTSRRGDSYYRYDDYRKIGASDNDDMVVLFTPPAI
jgi:hypothetical protein